MAPGGRNWWKHWSWRTNFISWSRKLGMYSTWMQTEWNYFWGIHKDVWITYFCWSNWEVTRMGEASRKVCGTVLRRGRTCSILRWAKLWIGKQESGAGIQSFKSLLGWSPIQTGRTWISWRIITSLLTNCLKTVCICHELEDQTFCGLSTNLQEQSQKWTQACDRRLARLISYIHHTYEFRQYCHVGNTAQHCLLGLRQDSDFAGDLEDSKIYFGWSLVYLWKPNIYHHQLDVQEKQTSVSANNTARRGEPAQGDLCGTRDHSINKNKTKTPTERRKRDIEQLSNVDYVPSNTHSSEGESQLYIFEHNEAVIKMSIKGRSPTIRHVSRNHRVALDWLFDRINSEPKIQINCVDTKNQLADMLTKAHFTRDEWNHLVHLFNIMSFSMFSCSHSAIFFLIRSKSRAPCQREVKKRVPVKVHQWQSQNQRYKRRRDQSTWFYAVRGARGKIYRRTWDIQSIQSTSMKDKVLILIQGILCRPLKIQKSNVPKWNDRRMLNVQIPENSAIRRSFALCQHKETCAGSNSKNGISKYEVHEPSVHDEDLPFPRK